MKNGSLLESVLNKGGKKYQGGQIEYCLTGLTPNDVITIELDGEGVSSNEAGIGIRALKGPWNQNSSVKDTFYVILTPVEQNIDTLGSCKSANNCWRTKLGYDPLTQKFIDLENPSAK